MQSDELNRMSQTIISDIKREFIRFLQEFGDRKYITMGESILDSGKHLIVISYQDFITHNSELASTIFEEYYRYEPHLNDAFTHLMRELERSYFIGQQSRIPPEESRQKYFITFDTEQHPESLRDLKCNRLGRLTVLQGTITRTTEVKPELSVGVFRCLSCGLVSRPIPQQFKYTEPKKCSGMNCDKVQWELEHTRSQFSDFQKLRIQEDPTKIPPGAMPRSLDVIIRDDNVQKGQPGDVCRFVGYLCVLPELSSMMKPGEKTIVSTRSIQNRGNMMEMEGITGLKGIRQLNYKLIFMATNIIVENNSFNEEMDEQEQEQRYDEERPKKPYEEQKIFEKAFEKLSEQEIMTIKQLKGDNNLYEQMANSLFPSIFGQPEIKKALLLQLFGGIHKVTSSRMNIRGDINILIVGDPSTAKSQFLKCVNKFVPRSVYTNGKTTSAAGLTASVSRDENGQVGIQAGALMLADNGICCIDEFDKMEIHDQVAIHEAMQQQTISIAKAGVHATLNARTSILAAANPLFGRYDKSKALKQNINISAPIMSRFDLFFVICDETSEASDAHLSEFLLNMHRNKERALTSKYDTKTLKLYISTARKLKPRLTIPAGELLKKYYHNLRVNDKTQHNTSYRVTVRQLQSMIRLSEAFARLHFELQITEEYVQEAHRLISTSIMKLEKSPIELLTDEMDQMGLQSKAFKAMDKKIEQIGEQKKSKSVSISHELYQEIVRNTLNFFKEQKLLSRTEQQPQIHQAKLTDYLLAINFENDMLNTEAETIHMRKIIGAVIKKMIREERILMTISEDNENGKILGVHPNYVQ